MTVTIAMPVLNGAATIRTALRSCVEQTFQDWKILLIDDGSSDDSLEIAASFRDSRIRIVADQRHLGLGARLNQAIEMCDTPYWARMDSDDVAYPRRLELQLAYLDKHPDVDLLGTRALVFGRGGRPLGLMPFSSRHDEICRRPWSGFYLPHPTWMGKTAWFRHHGYRADMRKSEDQDLLLRTYRTSRFACLEEVLLGYRQADLPIRKLTAYRWHFSRALIRSALEQRNIPRMVTAPAMQAAKATFEAVVLGIGAERLARRHRALTLPSVEKERWTALWNRVSSEVAGT